MSDLNSCHFIGRLGDAPDVRFMPNGNPVANIRIAVSEQWKDKQSGQKQEKTNWLTLVAFGKTAEIFQQYLQKGSRIQATCKAQVRKWQAQDGSDRYSTEFVVQDFQMLDSKPQGQQQGYQQQSQPQQSNQYQQQRQQNQASQQYQAPQNNAPAAGFDDFDDEIPFNRSEMELIY